MSRTINLLMCILVISAIAAPAHAVELPRAPRSTDGIDPTVFVTRTELKNIYDHGPRGARANTTVIRGDYIFHRVFKFRVDIPLVYVDKSDGDSRYGLGDVELRLGGLLAKTRYIRAAIGMDFSFDTATARMLGSGKYTIRPLFATSFYPSSWLTVVLPFLKYKKAFAGDGFRPDVNEFEVETDFQVSLPRGWWTELQSKVNVSFADNNRARWLLEFEVGKMLNKHIGLWIHPVVCPAGDRPFDFSIETGFRYLIKL